MMYNVNKIIDYLAELSGCKIKMLAHEKKNDEKLPLVIACCYTFCDVELL